MEINETRAYKYAQYCVDDDKGIVPKYVKKQAAVFIEICKGQNSEAYIDTKAVKLITKLLKIIMHPDTLKSMYESLEDYAMLIIFAAFCIKTRIDNTRYYQTILLEIARKNFKTFTSAVIFIIAMLTEPRFSRFFSVAPDYKLSSELRLAVRKIIKVSPLIEGSFKIKRDMIECSMTDSEYTPLAYSNDRLDGKLAKAFLADEAGAMDSYPVEAMRSSQVTIADRLGIIISTQYPNSNNVLIDEIDKAKKTLDNLRDNKRYFSLLYEPDEGIIDKWETNDNVILQANPVAVNMPLLFDSLKDLREDAILYENARENFLCKHCNIMYKSLGTEGYVDLAKLRECKQKESTDFWRGRTVYAGLDMSLTEDNTSIATCFEENGIIFGKVWAFIPKGRILAKSKKEGINYNMMISKGWCFGTGDAIIDYGFVEDFIINTLPQRYGINIAMLGYDKCNAMSTVSKLEQAGIQCVEIGQHSKVLHPATKLLKERILQGKFRYDENDLLEENFANARCSEDTNLNKYVNKKKSGKKVDMVVSLINAVHLLQQEQLYGMDFVIQTI